MRLTFNKLVRIWQTILSMHNSQEVIRNHHVSLIERQCKYKYNLLKHKEKFVNEKEINEHVISRLGDTLLQHNKLL